MTEHDEPPNLAPFDDAAPGAGIDNAVQADHIAPGELAGYPLAPGAPTPSVDVAGHPSPAAFTPVAGDPATDTSTWHMQAMPDTCAVVSQEFVLEQLTGQELDEGRLAQEALVNGWYQPGGGTSMANLDSLLEAHGVPTETRFDGTVDDIAQALHEGNKVIVPVDSGEIWEPGQDPYLEDSFGVPMPGQGADHAVEVIGIVDGPTGRMVVLNDPGSPAGCGEIVPLATFESAWADADGYWVKAGPTANDVIDALPAASTTLGTSTAVGTDESGDRVSYSFTDDVYFKDRTWEEVDAP